MPKRKNKIVIRLWEDDLFLGFWRVASYFGDYTIDNHRSYKSKPSALRAAKRALARIQACKEVEVVCDE